MNIFKRLYWVLSKNRDLESVMRKEKEKREEQEREERKHHLHLCKKHKQERNQSHYSPHNCDYCKLLAKVGNDEIVHADRTR